MSTHSTARSGHNAGLLDIRNIIGGLLGIYGVILFLLGVFATRRTRRPVASTPTSGRASPFSSPPRSS